MAGIEGMNFRAVSAPECPLSDEEREQAKRNLTWGVLKRTIRDLRRGRLQLALYRLRQPTLTLTDGFVTREVPPADDSRHSLATDAATRMKIVHALGWYYPESLGGTEIYVAGSVAG